MKHVLLLILCCLSLFTGCAQTPAEKPRPSLVSQAYHVRYDLTPEMQALVDETKRELAQELKTAAWAQSLVLDSLWQLPVYQAPLSLYADRVEAFYASQAATPDSAGKGRSIMILNDRLNGYPVGVVKAIIHHELLHAVDKWLGDQLPAGQTADVMQSSVIGYTRQVLGTDTLRATDVIARADLISHLRARYALLPVQPLYTVYVQDAWDQVGYYAQPPEMWARVYALHVWLVSRNLAERLDSPLTRRQLYIAMTYADQREHFFPLLFYWNLASLPND